MHESKHIYTAKLLQVNSYIERSALYVLQISKPNILGLYIYTEHDTVAYVCVYSRLLYCQPNIMQNKVDVSAIFVLLFSGTKQFPAR